MITSVENLPAIRTIYATGLTTEQLISTALRNPIFAPNFIWVWPKRLRNAAVICKAAKLGAVPGAFTWAPSKTKRVSYPQNLHTEKGLEVKFVWILVNPANTHIQLKPHKEMQTKYVYNLQLPLQETFNPAPVDPNNVILNLARGTNK